MAQHLSGPSNLTGQVALVTGGSGGMGRAIANAFKAAGALTIATDLGEHEDIGPRWVASATRRTSYRRRSTCVLPGGDLVEFHQAPEGYCTNLCFGGPDLRTAYITLSGYGQLFAANWPRTGLRLAAQELPPALAKFNS